MSTLPPFPVDEQALSLLEESLDTKLTWDEDEGVPVIAEGEFTFSQLLEFYSGYVDPDPEAEGVYEYEEPLYHYFDVIRALINEVRRLRRKELGL